MKKVRVRKVKRRIHENMAVYSTLRDEIIAIQEMQRNMYLYMHTLFAALYAVGVQFGYMFFLLAFIVILPFQSKINAYSWSITRLSIYIRVFFEETRNDIHWESFQTYPQFMDTAQTKKMSPTGWIGNNSTLILGVLAWGSFIWGPCRIFII